MIPDWPACGYGVPACGGAQVAAGLPCWRHLDREEFRDAVSGLTPDACLDLRGTVMEASRLAEILDHIRGPDGRARIGAASCENASFIGIVRFDDVIVLRHSSFGGASFSAGASFSRTRFGGGADFSAVTFGGTVTFADAQFGASVSFQDAQFAIARFTGTAFQCDVSFENAHITTELTMESGHGAGKLRLGGLQAAGQVDIQAQVAAVCCTGAEFADRVRLRLAGGQLWLTGTVFGQPASVESWPRFAETQAGPVVDDPSVAVRSLRGVDAEHLTLADADLSRCLIYGLRRPEQLRLAGHISFAPVPRGWNLRWRWLPWRWTNREALYEEYLWRRRSATAALGWTNVLPDEDDCGQDAGEKAPLSPAGLAVLYRQLRQAVEDARNEPGAADLYYGEMEMRRLSTQGRDERWLLTAYWLVSGYGLRASRAMLVLGGLLLAAAEALQRIGFGGHHTHGYLDCLLYAMGSVLSLDLSGHLPAVLTDWGQVIRMILRISGPVLLGLGALAIRGRIKR